jgi:hypothetical protein
VEPWKKNWPLGDINPLKGKLIGLLFFTLVYQRKKALGEGLFGIPERLREDRKKEGSDLLSHLTAVPSALRGLTSLFGMGRGGTPSL